MTNQGKQVATERADEGCLGCLIDDLDHQCGFTGPHVHRKPRNRFTKGGSDA